MPFIQAAVADAQEERPAPEGEYDLTIKHAEAKTSRNGNNGVSVLIVIDDPDLRNVAPINHWITLPTPDDKYRDFHLRQMKRFLVLFDCPFEDNGFDTDDLIGQSARAGLGLQAVKDQDGNETGAERNFVKLPPVKDEKEEVEQPKRRAGGRRR